MGVTHVHRRRGGKKENVKREILVFLYKIDEESIIFID